MNTSVVKCTHNLFLAFKDVLLYFFNLIVQFFLSLDLFMKLLHLLSACLYFLFIFLSLQSKLPYKNRNRHPLASFLALNSIFLGFISFSTVLSSFYSIVLTVLSYLLLIYPVYQSFTEEC